MIATTTSTNPFCLSGVDSFITLTSALSCELAILLSFHRTCRYPKTASETQALRESVPGEVLPPPSGSPLRATRYSSCSSRGCGTDVQEPGYPPAPGSLMRLPSCGCPSTPQWQSSVRHANPLRWLLSGSSEREQGTRKPSTHSQSRGRSLRVQLSTESFR